jgi:hypothetical protein
MVKKGKIAEKALEEKLEGEETEHVPPESTPGGHAEDLSQDDDALERAQDLGLHTEETPNDVDDQPTLEDEAEEAREARQLPPQLAKEKNKGKEDTWKGLSPFQAFLKKLGIKHK